MGSDSGLFDVVHLFSINSGVTRPVSKRATGMGYGGWCKTKTRSVTRLSFVDLSVSLGDHNRLARTQSTPRETRTEEGVTSWSRHPRGSPPDRVGGPEWTTTESHRHKWTR